VAGAPDHFELSTRTGSEYNEAWAPVAYSSMDTVGNVSTVTLLAPTSASEIRLDMSRAGSSLASGQVSSVLSITTETGDRAVFGVAEIRVRATARVLTSVAPASSFRQSVAATPTVISVAPRQGSTAGGTRVRISGNFQGGQPSAVFIEGIPCAIFADDGSATATSVDCLTGYHGHTTGDRNGRYVVDLRITGKGSAVPETAGAADFRYADFWSSPTTWGGDRPPTAGDLVHIPSGHVVVLDVSPPKLAVLVVEGTLEFDDSNIDHVNAPSHIRLDAHYITVVRGTFQIGTEDAPYRNRATVTLHGTPSDTELPMYGSKVLACRECTLDLHGAPELQTWTQLAATSLHNSTTLQLQQKVDWAVGASIVVASTDHVKEHAEVVNVAALSADGLTVTLDRPLEHTHQGETLGPFGNPPFDPDFNFIEVRAEVGLLSRNVVIQGDQDSVPWQFGATVMMFSPGDESLTARIENIEVRRAGQAHRLGRYPLHFHMIGTVRRSYARSNSVHTTYNRAFTIHGVHYLRVQRNVAYNVMGHTYFIEDAIETKNIIEYNLGVLTRRSFALLNTDITPATFW
jgi:hypothetical protein